MFKIHPEVPNSMSDEAKAFIVSCFEADPDKRVTASALLQQPFLKASSRKKSKTLGVLGEVGWGVAGDGERWAGNPRIWEG